MKYVGSKNRLSKYIAPIIQSYIDKGCNGYLEPFVGGANMIDKIKCDKKYGSDTNEYLIETLKALSNGWIPPKQINENMYKKIRKEKNNYPPELVGYVGFQLSFGGKWFGGYRKDKVGKRNYSKEAYDNTIRQIPLLNGCCFKTIDFRDINEIKGYVIYCDPPYKGTTKYATDEFPYEEFYEWCRKMSKNNVVLISEYDMPSDFKCIWYKEVKTLLNNE